MKVQRDRVGEGSQVETSCWVVFFWEWAFRGEPGAMGLIVTLLSRGRGRTDCII